MYCSNCGQPLKDRVNFCSNCGMKIVWPAEPQTEPVGVQTETAETTQAEVSQPSAEEEPVTAETETAPESEENTAPEPVTDAVSEEPAAETVTEVTESEPEAVPEEAAEKTAAAESEVPEAEVTETVPEEKETESSVSESEGTETAPEQKAEEVPAEKEVTKTAEPAKKDKKKPLKYGGIAAALVILGLLIYNMLPSTKYNRAVKAAEEYMLEVNYAAASEEYEKALTIRPEDEAVSADAAAAFVMAGAEFLDEGKYDETIAFADRTMPLLKEADRDPVRTLGEEAYTYKADDMVMAGDFAGAKTCLQEGIDKGYGLQTKLADVEKEEKYLEVAAAQKEFLADIAKRLDGDDYEGALDIFKDEYGQLAADDIAYGYRGPLTADISGGKYKKAGLYKDGGYYAVYYGDYSGDSREGNGIYLIYNPGGLFSLNTRYYVTGEWKGDMPNGTVTENRKIYDGSDLQQEAVIKVTVKDGIYNGDVEWTQDGETYYGSYTDGIINVLDTTDPNGEANKVAMYNSDKSAWRYYTSEGPYSRVFGMIGFGQQ